MSAARPRAVRGSCWAVPVLVVAGLAAGCASEAADPADDTPVCAAIREAAALGIESSAAMSGDWAEATATLTTNIAATDDVYRDLIDADVPEVSEAAADLLAFDEAIVASGALEAGSAAEFAGIVGGLQGSAEAGAADVVVKEYARETCGFEGDDGAAPGPDG